MWLVRPHKENPDAVRLESVFTGGAALKTSHEEEKLTTMCLHVVNTVDFCVSDDDANGGGTTS